jgi:ABC-type tungstate transport system, permease component
MGKILLMASEMGAYTLTDRGTWLAYKDKLSLTVLNEGGILLKTLMALLLLTLRCIKTFNI